jgi:tetratricopeptide (TPR) repeat protein
VFSWSYRALDADAARLFRLLGPHPGPDLGAPAAASLAGLPPARTRRLLAELARAHLVVEHAPGRYGLHDLLRAYATERAREAEAPARHAAAVGRTLDHYLHSAHAAAMLLSPARDPITVPAARPGVTPERPPDHAAAMAWFAAEYPVLRDAIDLAAAAGFDDHAWRLAWTLLYFLDRRGHWHDWTAVQRTALAAARRLGDPTAQATCHRLLALAQIQLGRYAEADAHLRRALARYADTGDRAGEAYTRIHLGMAASRQGRYADALAHAEQALELFRAAGHRAGQALALNNVGWLHAQLGDHRRALRRCAEALALQEEVGNSDDQAATWDSLGYAHHHLGDHDQAFACYQRALDLRREIGDRYGQANTLTHLGDVRQAAGDPVGARDAWRAAVAILEELGHADADGLRGRLGPAQGVAELAHSSARVVPRP